VDVDGRTFELRCTRYRSDATSMTHVSRSRHDKDSPAGCDARLRPDGKLRSDRRHSLEWSGFRVALSLHATGLVVARAAFDPLSTLCQPIGDRR
jgi:hypothetical protein